jgi:alpha-mannosidase
VHGRPAETPRSLIEVDSPQVVVEAIKRAEDSDATIVRLYEAWAAPCKVRLRTTLAVSRAFLCDLLERDRQEIRVTDGVIELELTPFKILTLKLENQKPQGARRR